MYTVILNYVEFVSNDQLSSAIIQHGHSALNINEIRTPKCEHTMCLFNDKTTHVNIVLYESDI